LQRIKKINKMNIGIIGIIGIIIMTAAITSVIIKIKNKTK